MADFARPFKFVLNPATSMLHIPRRSVHGLLQHGLDVPMLGPSDKFPTSGISKCWFFIDLALGDPHHQAQRALIPFPGPFTLQVEQGDPYHTYSKASACSIAISISQRKSTAHEETL